MSTNMSTKLSRKPTILEFRLFIEAWCFLALSRILIFWLPFRKLLPLLGCQISREQAEIADSNPVASCELLELIRISILRASRRSPWRTMCFEQALSARIILRLRGIKSVIYFGVCLDILDQPEKRTAHAWLKCSGVVVTGGKNNSNFTIVGRFLI